MQETALLGIFVALPVILCFVLFLFFPKIKQHRKSPWWLSLLVGNSLVLLFLCSIVLVSGEIYYRFYHDTTDSFGLTKTTQRWFKRHYHLNNTPYFRDSMNYMPIIQPGKRRVTFLGDSFTAGHGVPNVEDRFANRIRAANPSHEVHVLAECGTDTGHQLSLLTALQVDHYELDLVVLVYCLNDIADIVPEWERILTRVYDSPPPGYLVEHSYFLNTLYYRLKAARDPDVSNYYQFVHDNYQGPVWKQQQQRLKTLRDEVRENGGQLLVVTFPFLHALGPDYEYQTIHERLAELWDELGVPHLDLLSTYESCNPDELVVNAYDAHPNETAHEKAAKAIAEFLKKYLLN